MITIFDDAESLAKGAASFFVDQARQAAHSRGRFSVLLAGGETPRRLYQTLAQVPFVNQIAWEYIHFFWGDERCVPFEDPRSNGKMVHDVLLDHLSLRPNQIHHLRYDLPPQAAADEYQRELALFFESEPPRFDLVLLGLGEDGHTASLLPGSDSLLERNHWTAVARRSEEDFSRVTLTVPLLNQARTMLFLVSGIRKAEIVKEILGDSPSPKKYPVQLVHPESGGAHWFLDHHAASLLDA